MKIQYQSDLHIEFFREEIDYQISDIGADLLILAGDVGLTDRRYFDWLLKQTEGTPTLMVLGNHEFYGMELYHTVEVWKKALVGSSVQLLDKESVVIDGVRFIGATLWTDYLLNKDEWQASSMQHAQERMNDHRLIKIAFEDEQCLFSTYHALDLHLQHRLFIEAELDRGDPSVVITHHAPIRKSIEFDYREDPLAPAFASDLSKVIFRNQPEAWIHGHVHHSVDICIGKTRVVCNPRGYERLELNPDFDPKASIEIET
ncbi:metallophosphoesterase [Dongshaea marina]|uniref:metallophosphoesterase n=1 Tax=Dongshaea marina TaxID=2047966 RepID=UPI000D3E4118|nr:metallophosphoesterase [Dongshaea marina]